ncbi:class I SAM-dependent methyltransferase [Sulfuricystis multivorans]|uniref:class I SAM-dependent methyltransferase n=1 Tax=Sulfuricystis multivorans TaxID=2211108 RepID=UPI0015593EF8|nr:class I SAM-dependent methyltransferase [Sulfuricystis multivorans]
MRNSSLEHSPLKGALLAQLGGAAATFLFVAGLSRLSSADFLRIPLLIALLQGGLAAMIALKLKAPRWWIPIHLVFMPLVVLVHGLDIAPGWFLAAFVLLLLVFWRTDASRVPLYLTNRATADALLELLPAVPCHILDLGCGDGGLLRRLALARPDCLFTGIEHAPLTWLVARLRCAGLPNVTILRRDFWTVSFGGHAVVYAFLSPAPMPRLWVKAQREMSPGALLVSNSFAVPEQPADATIEVADRRNTRLFLYHPVPDG